jgi:hypothetical protein
MCEKIDNTAAESCAGLAAMEAVEPSPALLGKVQGQGIFLQMRNPSGSTLKNPVDRQTNLELQTCDVLRALAGMSTQHRNAYFLYISPAGMRVRLSASL